MKIKALNFCLLLIALTVPFKSICQRLNWDINLTKPVTFTSYNPHDDPGTTVDQMWKVSMRDLMRVKNNFLRYFPYGILGTLNDSKKGKVKVSVYLYDSDTSNKTGRGPMIFECFKDKNDQGSLYANQPNHYELGNWLAWWPDAGENNGGFYFNDYWKSNDANTAALAATFYNYDNKFSNWKVPGTGTAVVPAYPADADTKLPVIIEVTIYKANVEKINIPGVGSVEPAYFRTPYLDIQATETKVTTQNCYFELAINKPASGDGIFFSDVTIYLSPLGDMNKVLPIDTKVISKDQIPYSNKSFKLSLPKEENGEYMVWAKYDIYVIDINGKEHSYPGRSQFLFNYNFNGVLPAIFQRVYEVAKTYYEGLRVYTLQGGMSAEYGVEKSLASLSSGISETWNVRSINGIPDLKGGGPVSVYPDYNKFDFLDRSVQKTVKLYNDNLGATTPFETVIIGTGVAHVPYLSNAMKAPFLPIHFLVSVHSVAEVQRILDTANKSGYSAFSMLGYDPSIDDSGVAWIKLRELPPAYKQFLVDHKVKNVIIMGYQEGVANGEPAARRILIEGQPDEEFSQGSLYMMSHEDMKIYKGFYRDFYRWNFGEEKTLVDWEGGITNDQVENFSTDLKKGGIRAFTIQTNDSRNFYEWALDIQLYLLRKNNMLPKRISMNEYLIGFPEFELYTGTVPYLYWQGLPAGLIAFNTYDFTSFKIGPSYPDDFKSMPVYIQAKADRSLILDSLKNYFTNVKVGSWQKADVWDPGDGLNSPCELVADAIVKNLGGATAFKEWNDKRAVIDFDDFAVMAKNSIKPVPSADPKLFPKPVALKTIETNDDAGLSISTAYYDPNTYWQPPNFPNNVELRSFTNDYPGDIVGYLDGQARPHDIRKQAITTAQFDLENRSDEYDLRMGYKFNVNDKDGLLSYDPKLGEEQKMDCFEFTSIPYNHWFDIPSRVMAKTGAVWIINGGVYDFDYNGLPGVVPFIKKNGEIKAQPQILSFKGEGAFAWKWGANKSALILSRPKEIPSANLPFSLGTLFQLATESYPNVMGAMTFMSGNGLYDITALQPDWMKNYPPFPPFYLTASRCFFAPLSVGCIGTEVVAPVDDGWNDCEMLKTDNAVQRFSTLAYRQYPQTFDDVPNARSFIGIKGSKLDIGIIDGDYGKSGYRGPIATKTLGMHVYEESQFRLARGYDQFVNLDGGSSTQMWLNGRGPLHILNGYILKKDNQGPYYSRLISSYIMLVPKLHKELIRQNVIQADPRDVPSFDNSDVNFYYSDNDDLDKPKAFIDFSPCADSLNKTDGAYGFIAGNFSMSGKNITKHGGILFYTGEDMYYPDTKGLKVVQPRLRNLMVVGVGLVLPSLVDTLKKLPVAGGLDPGAFRLLLTSENISAYYIKVFNGEVVEFLFNGGGKTKYLTGNHRFYIRSDGQSSDVPGRNIFFAIDGIDLSNLTDSHSYFPELKTGFFNIGECTHAYVGALNLDGRFLTGDIDMRAYNYLFAVGKAAWQMISGSTSTIDQSLAGNTLPNSLAGIYYKPGIYAVQCLETSGQHVFALAPPGQNRFYGLRLNNFIFKKKPTVIKSQVKSD